MSVVKAVFKRNLASFFGNPAGYVFIILFVGMTAWFAFVTEGFFASNQANLNQLTLRMPLLLMIFVASVTMSAWAEEKKLGTDELLFTLPGGDLQVVLGKFLAALAVFTAALFFTFSHVLILWHLGDPDVGLLFATYLGYWLMGAAFIATGMFASSLTHNITVGFILGTLFCAVFAFMQDLALLLPGRLGETLIAFAAVTHLESFSRGVVALEDAAYFTSIAVGMLYLNAVVLGRRRWPGGAVPMKEHPRYHTALRIFSVAVILVSADVLFARFGGRLDVTQERLSSLSVETEKVLSELSSDRPVYIQAWVSRDVPPMHVETRDNLLGLLREYDKRGGDAVLVKIYRPDRFSQEARDAKDKYQIQAMPVYLQEEGEGTTDEIFMGAAFTCGIEEEVIPFFHPGIPIEYELTRTIRVVSKGERPRVGVIDNELKLFGGFDFQTRSRSIPWQIVEELRKQYEVDNLRLDAEVPEDIDVVVSALPSLLTEEQLDRLIETIQTGKPTLLLMDPLPLADIGLSPQLPRPNPQANPFMGMGQPPPADPKCDLNRLLDLIGVRWSPDSIVWDVSNPHPQLRHLTPEFVFVTGPGRNDPEGGGFNGDDPTSSGLQEVLALFSGSLGKAVTVKGELTFEPLIRTPARTSGEIAWSRCVEQSFFGPRLAIEMLERIPRRTSPLSYVLAARIRGEVPVEEKDEPPGVEEEATDPAAATDPEAPPRTARIDVIAVADLDLISDQFFEIRKGRRWIEFDNVPFVLNCVDALAGEEDFIALRKRRLKLRSLTRIEAIDQEFMQEKLNREAQAEAEAQAKLQDAQESFDEKVEAVENRTDLDTRTKDIMVASVRRVEEQRLEAKKETIEEEKNNKIEESRFAMEQEKRRIRRGKKTMAMILPVIPPLLIGIAVFLIRRAREVRGATRSRLMRD